MQNIFANIYKTIYKICEILMLSYNGYYEKHQATCTKNRIKNNNNKCYDFSHLKNPKTLWIHFLNKPDVTLLRFP